MTAPAQNQFSGSLSVESAPPFSVLMSLYAREQPEYLRQCLASLAAQTLPPNEIVLVYDGGLPENLEAVVASFSGSLGADRGYLKHTTTSRWVIGLQPFLTGSLGRRGFFCLPLL